MKVLLVTPNFPTESNLVNGNMVLSLAGHIREKGVDLRVLHIDEKLFWPLTLMKRYKPPMFPNHTELEDFPGVTRFPVPNFPGALGVTMHVRMYRQNILNHLRSTWPGWAPDLVHARTFLPSGLAAEILMRHWSCPLLISTHGYDTRSFIHRRLPRKDILRLCRIADEVIASGESIGRILRLEGAQFKRFCLIYNGMEASRIWKGPTGLENPWQNRRVIVGIGNLVKTKGFDLLALATARLRKEYPSLLTVIIGDGPEMESLQTIRKKLSLDGHLELIGRKTPEDTLRYLPGCEFFCLPSWSEGFGIAYLEALAHGKPVIGIKGQGISDLISKFNIGTLAEPKNLASLIDSMSFLLENQDMAKNMGQRGRELVLREFKWEDCADKYIDEYNRIVDDTR